MNSLQITTNKRRKSGEGSLMSTWCEFCELAQKKGRHSATHTVWILDYKVGPCCARCAKDWENCFNTALSMSREEIEKAA